MRYRYHLIMLGMLLLPLAMPVPAAHARQEGAAAPAATAETFDYFSFMHDSHYSTTERAALWIVLAVAVAGLLYAGGLVGQVLGADQGTPKMQMIAKAIREGANAYLYRQFKAIILLVFLIVGILYAAAETAFDVRIGRAMAFLLGSLFSWLVGFVGMSLAVRG
ncbi:MAG: sodium/proton-translocating pyrophosphatase, partial [Candidatus Geothermincolia bacterium]